MTYLHLLRTVEQKLSLSNVFYLHKLLGLILFKGVLADITFKTWECKSRAKTSHKGLDKSFNHILYSLLQNGTVLHPAIQPLLIAT